MRLSENFSLEELTASEAAARLGLGNEPGPAELANLTKTAFAMERVRNLLGGRAIHVNSGYRSKSLNATIGGASTSAHCLGWAVDFICPKFGTPFEVCSAISRSDIHFDQLILEFAGAGGAGGWAHISFDPRMRGQVLTKKSASMPYEHGLIG